MVKIIFKMLVVLFSVICSEGAGALVSSGTAGRVLAQIRRRALNCTASRHVL